MQVNSVSCRTHPMLYHGQWFEVLSLLYIKRIYKHIYAMKQCSQACHSHFKQSARSPQRSHSLVTVDLSLVPEWRSAVLRFGQYLEKHSSCEHYVETLLLEFSMIIFCRESSDSQPSTSSHLVVYSLLLGLLTFLHWSSDAPYHEFHMVQRRWQSGKGKGGLALGTWSVNIVEEHLRLWVWERRAFQDFNGIPESGLGETRGQLQMHIFLGELHKIGADGTPAQVHVAMCMPESSMYTWVQSQALLTYIGLDPCASYDAHDSCVLLV